ncbi:glutathione S-transferase family protein [Prochlorococcus sp. MIT 1223]|uniref:glutathione S-transferase family protein n=1 Tax=Prochlorococcus sp. MIT 1223 TaxID=3096217 RepID=UPI002A75BD89|nr:glutathione S-transferase C-terminal domain-containing protein [Prochlorococcus sp. MIT 1223]
MPIPPLIVATAKKGWHWQWNQLMNGLAPSDIDGNYLRPISQKLNAIAPSAKDLLHRPNESSLKLIIGRSCPWAHRTWLVYKIRKIDNKLDIFLARPNLEKGLWDLEPSLLGCKSLIDLYRLCQTPPSHRATVPALIDPGIEANQKPRLLGNESAQLVEVLNSWPTQEESQNLAPVHLQNEIHEWSKIFQLFVNDGVYRCGFARNQKAYEKASNNLFNVLEKLEKHLSQYGPWICGETLTLADIRLFPTLIRWEIVYEPLFICSGKALWIFPNICKWRKRFFEMSNIAETCDSRGWRQDYFGALFPLRPSNIIPKGLDIKEIVKGPQN